MRPVETLQVRRDTDDAFTGYMRWLLRGVDALGHQVEVVDYITIATKDMSGLVKELSARVCIRDSLVRDQYMRVYENVMKWLAPDERLFPSRALHEGFMLFHRKRG